MKISSLSSLIRPLVAGLVLLSPALYATAARAQLTFTLANPTQTGVRGQTLSFAGTLRNTGTQALFLNSYNFTLNGMGLTLDDTGLANFIFGDEPFSLQANQSVTGTFFSVAVASNAPTLTGNQSSFTIQGGPTDQSFNNLATANFQVNVGAAASAAPEPGSIALLLPALGGIGLAVTRRKR